jgi:multidrug efflux pump
MGYFYMNGKQYQILGEINRQQRNTPLDLKSVYLKNNQGNMIQLDNLVELKETVAPPQLYRYNRFNSATVSAGLAPGVTIGVGLDEMDRIAKETLDDSFRTALSGDSKDFRESSSSLLFAFVLALVLIFLILAAQFESFKDPFVIMFCPGFQFVCLSLANCIKQMVVNINMSAIEAKPVLVFTNIPDIITTN